MSERGIFPRTDAAFNTYANNAAKYLLDNKARLRLDEDAITLQGNTLKDWNFFYPQSKDENASTKTIKDTKNALRKSLESGFRTIYGDIPQSVLTLADRNALNLKKRDVNPTRVPVMDKAPGLEMEKIVHLQHTLRFSNPFDVESQEMPLGQKIVLESFTGDAKLDEAEIVFGNAKNVTRFLKKVAYTAAEVGKTTYYRATYVNSRGEQGPWSEMFVAVIA